jgi:hypothetical protein
LVKWVRLTGLAPGIREQMQVGEWTLAAGAQDMRHLMLSYADTKRPT